MKDCMENFARAILRAQEHREESYNEEKKEYTLSHKEAAERGAIGLGFDQRVTQPICLLNLLAWNDIQAWAEKTII